MFTVKGWIPLFIVFALSALGLKLSQFTCLACSIESPLLTILGTFYFLTLLTLFLFFPKFPKPKLSKLGLLVAIGLATLLTYQSTPNWCILCLIAHTCNIVIWTLWLIAPNEQPSLKKKVSLSLLSVSGAVALLTCLHLIIPSPKLQQKDLSKALHVINFVSPDCVYCKDQLPVLDNIALQLKDHPCRFINVTPSSLEELSSRAPHTEWIEDQEGKLHDRFHVTAYPTTIILESDGTVARVFQGVSQQLFEDLNHLNRG